MGGEPSRGATKDTGAPAWLLLFAGGLWAATQLTSTTPFQAGASRQNGPSSAGELAFGKDTRGESLDPRPPETFRSPGTDEKKHGGGKFDGMGPRELRRLPGIGQARALAIAHTRWQVGPAGGLRILEQVPGIGPETAKRVREWFEKGSERP